MTEALAPARRYAAAGVVAVLALLAAVAVHREATRPGAVFLRDAPPGQWIRDGDPFYLIVSRREDTRAYRTRFAVDAVPASAPLLLRTTGAAVVLLDARPIAELPAPADPNELRTLDLAPQLAAGEHDLEIRVTNHGASVVAASLAAFGVATSRTWLALGRDGVWRDAAPASAPEPTQLAQDMSVFARPAALWLAASAALSLGAGALLARRHRVLRTSPAQLRTLLLAIWSLVAVNDFFKLPGWMGMDFAGHLAYVKFIVERGALPLATDGWQMFQSPLYYLLCAGIATGFDEWNGLVVRLFRVISIASALAQIEIAYRIARRVFAGLEDLQKIAIAVSGLLPMGFCISQGIGNEPLHAALAAWTLLLALGAAEREGPLALRDAALLGAAWGLALLAKVSAALLAAPLAWLLFVRIARRPTGWPRELAGAAVASAACAAVAGWYYARNWLLLGTPFVGGWLPRGDAWWQEPGYRLSEQWTRFGTALFWPWNAAIRGFWDGYHSTLWADGNLGSITEWKDIPPWNYAPMWASHWVAALPTALVLIGFFAALRPRRDRSAELLQAGAIAFAAQIAAALVLFVSVPIYSQVKATHTLALTPVFGLLAAHGCDCVGKRNRVRIALHAGLFGWAALVLCSYFVI
jgi:Dolichyl-phosphate-mannose-protein mannosyltransferase